MLERTRSGSIDSGLALTAVRASTSAAALLAAHGYNPQAGAIGRVQRAA